MEARICIITGFGINADEELLQAFRFAANEIAGRGAGAGENERAGRGGAKMSLGPDAQPTAVIDKVHITDLLAGPEMIKQYHIIAFPGGFSFGDHLGSGLVFAHLCREKLGASLRGFVAQGGLIIGICNGFQILVKMGLIPNLDRTHTQTVSLIHNSTGVFEDSWVDIRFNERSHCVWTRGLSGMEMPIRHGEGRFVARSEEILDQMEEKELIVMRYAGRNPNGSVRDIAGITDSTGRILGMMPHPEAFLFPYNHPRWTREPIEQGYGVLIFKNGLRFVYERSK